MTDPEQINTDLTDLATALTPRPDHPAHLVLVDPNGLLLALSDHLLRNAADQLAAVASGLCGLTRGASGWMGGGTVRQSIIEYTHGHLLLTPMPDGSCLAALTGPDCDIGQAGYEMTLLADQLTTQLDPTIRHQLRTALPPVPSATTAHGRRRDRA